MKQKIYTIFTTHYKQDQPAQKSLKSGHKRVLVVNFSVALGQRRSKVYKQFCDLTPDQKSHWETKAVEKHIENCCLVRVKSEELERYVDGWLERLNGLVSEGHTKAGISFVGFFAYEGHDAQGSACHHVKDYVLTDIKEYAQSEEFVDARSGFTKWYQDNEEVVIPGESPMVAVIPDPVDFYRLRYLEIGDKPQAHTIRVWNWQYINAEYGFSRGAGATPWKEIADMCACGEVGLWIPNWPTDLAFHDPSRLSVLDAKDPQLCAQIIKFFETINAIEHHGPIKTSGGIWDLSNAVEPLPSLLPSSKPKDVRASVVAFLLDFWLPESYYLTDFMAERQGFGKHVTSDWFFSWLDSLNHSSFIHRRSNTIQAGDGGVVWPGVALLHAADVNTEPLRRDIDDDKGSNIGEPDRNSDLRAAPKGKGKVPVVRKTRVAPKPQRHMFREIDEGISEIIIMSSDKGTGEAPVIDQAFFEPGPISEDWTSRTHIFGLFAPQPAVPEHTGSPQDLLVNANQVIKEAKQGIEHWKSFDGTCLDSYPGLAIAHAKTIAQHAPLEEIWPILIGILLHHYDMNHAASLWSRVQQLMQPVILACRKASCIFQVINALFSTEFSSRPGPVKNKLQQLREPLQQAILTCRAIFQLLSEMQSLATRYANDLQNEWNSDIFSLGLNRQISLAHALAQWRDDMIGMAHDLRNYFISQWHEHELPNDQLPQPIHFQFGCPQSDIFDSAAHTTRVDRSEHLISPHPEQEQDQSFSSNAAAVDGPRCPSVPLASSPACPDIARAVGMLDDPNSPSRPPQYMVSSPSILPESNCGATAMHAPTEPLLAICGQSPTTFTSTRVLLNPKPSANALAIEVPATGAETGCDRAAGGPWKRPLLTYPTLIHHRRVWKVSLVPAWQLATTPVLDPQKMSDPVTDLQWSSLMHRERSPAVASEAGAVRDVEEGEGGGAAQRQVQSLLLQMARVMRVVKSE
ncbi:hypothetical protein FRC06_003896 [Ceratobasidium sp. 370]|nr:hypothetical protein FRC06_003896 [Ceratobasidium sp. 370]